MTINLPTTLPLPAHGMNFHLSHRFNEDLRSDSIGTQFSNAFGLDNGANIGLEFRYGVMKHLEAIVLRTSISKTIQFSASATAGTRPRRSRWTVGDRLDRRRQQLPQHRRGRPGELRAGDRRRRLPQHRRQTGALRHADVGAQHRHRGARATPTPASSGSAAAFAWARARSSCLRRGTALGGLMIGNAAAIAFAIERARRRPRVLADLQQWSRHHLPARSRTAAFPEHLTLGFNLTRKFY